MSPLVAKLDGRYVLSDDLSEEDRGKPYTCDNCEKRLIVVIPIWKTKHFRHEQDDGCTCNTERETKEHILMKQNLMKILSQWNPEYEVELEKKVTVNAAPNGFRVADILLTSRTNNRKIVVESQASQISEDEVLKRTLDYNENGCAILWILSSTFSPYRDESSRTQELRVSDIELMLHRMYFRRVYYFDVGTSRIYASHFGEATRENERFGYAYYLKKTKVVESKVISEPRIYETRTSFAINQLDEIMIARFKETKWWSSKTEEQLGKLLKKYLQRVTINEAEKEFQRDLVDSGYEPEQQEELTILNDNEESSSAPIRELRIPPRCEVCLSNTGQNLRLLFGVGPSCNIICLFQLG